MSEDCFSCHGNACAVPLAGLEDTLPQCNRGTRGWDECVSVELERENILPYGTLYSLTLWATSNHAMSSFPYWVSYNWCNVLTLPTTLTVLWLKSPFPAFSMQTALLPLHCWRWIPPVHHLCNDEAWSLHRHLHPCFCGFFFVFLSLCHLVPSAFSSPPPPFTVRGHHGELSSSFTEFLHRCAQLSGLWRLFQLLLWPRWILYICATHSK